MIPAAVTTHKFELNEEQQAALYAMQQWLSPEGVGQPFFILEGFAGTGKTFTCKALIAQVRGRVAFTAPTNKAVKVLRETLTTDSYKPECATIYSLLGLRMEANGEVKELRGRDKNDEEAIDLSLFKLVVVDEGSMVGKVLMPHIQEAAEGFGVQFLFMGDAAQLPPVKEATAAIWALGPHEAARAKLTTVMRHDNQILNLVTRIRGQVDAYAPKIALAGDHDERGGVWLLRGGDFERKIRQRASAGDFADGQTTKVVAWRNATVDSYNRVIREVIFEGAATQPWLTDDRVIFTGPGKDLDDRPMVRTDDEGRVMSAAVQYHPVYGSFKCWRVSVTLDDSRVVTAYVLHGGSAREFEAECNDLAARKSWREFWALKEAFHGLRHAYAITAHRAQGSTYRTVFVDYQDILINRNRQEAYRCLYVACSRPTTNLILG